ncbi:MAG: hydantoinase/oxoprolinase family protein [Solirubrobacterales bacterium]
MKRVAVDVGGTFTDVMYWDDESGVIHIVKVSSTPRDQGVGVMDGLRQACAAVGVGSEELEMFVHGTTAATNAVLEHRGATVGLITTEGFRDILHIGRKKRPLNFSSQQDLPWQTQPLVRRRHRIPVRERIRADGSVEVPLDEDAVRAAVRRLRAEEVDAIAVCFLFSVLNDAHERRAVEIVAEEWPGMFVSASYAVAPRYREYERFSTTALNAFVGPEVGGYIERLGRMLGAAGVGDHFHLMTSAGGMATDRSAAREPVTLLMSGVVAGLRAGCEIGRASGYPSVITLDVGGTSADVGVAPAGEVRLKHLLDTRIGGYAAMIPMADVETIGAGGGSIAQIDEGGMFRVGPESAGALPGPVAYGRGGRRPTATDAMVTLGWIRPASFSAGGIALDREAARATIESELAGPLGESVEFAAMGVFEILSQAMVEAIGVQSIRKGYHPAEFALVPLGGAGGLFAWRIAQELEIPTVVVPRHPGVSAAMGLLTCDLQYELAKTVWFAAAGGDPGQLGAAYAELERAARAQLQEDGLDADRVRLVRTADCRYEGQGYELRVSVPDGAIDAAWIATARERFEAAHERTYTHRFADARVQLVNIGVTAIGELQSYRAAPITSGAADPAAALLTTASLFLPRQVGREPVAVEAPVYDRDRLLAGNEIAGPALVEQADATTIVGFGQCALVDAYGHLVIAVAPTAEASKGG